MNLLLTNLWFYFFFLVVIGALLTLIPIIVAFLKKVKLDKVPNWFGEATEFEEQQTRLISHELRIEGTLVYWKNQAAAHHRLYMARVFWSLISAVTLPVIIQFYDKTEFWSVTFLTTMTVFSGFIVALAYAMKSEELYRGYRECESDYYDTARTLLDHPCTTPDERKQQVDDFLITVKRIRRAGRKVETSTPPSGVSTL